jgi:hypothetical protein
MHGTKKTARVAGLLYLLVAITGAFSAFYVPHTLIVRGNAAATAANILASEMLFRSGIVCELISAALLLGLEPYGATSAAVRNACGPNCKHPRGGWGIVHRVLALDYGRKGSAIGRPGVNGTQLP